MDEYKISIGVELDTSDIISQIGEAERKADPIKIKIDAETKELTNTIKTALNTLSRGAKSALILDTSKIESSFKDVASVIKDIKTSLGTLDSKSGMKDLLTSINQIGTALEKASSQFNELNVSLNSLASKDFSINLGLNMGGSNNPIGRNAAYGSKVRNETLPQLKQQMDAFVKYYNDTYKSSLNEFEVLQKLVSGTKLNSGDFFETFLFGKDSVATRMSGGSLSGQMQAYKQYIDMFKQAAGLKGLDLSSVTSGFSKSTDELIKDAQDIQTGANEMQDSFEKLKQIFGGGNSIDTEGISVQLDSIIADLGEIKTALQGLSSGVSLDGLTQSFDKLSTTLEQLMTNAKLVQDVLGSAGANTGASNQAKEAQETANAYREVANEAKKIDNIKIDISSGNVDDLRSALKNLKVDDSSIENATKEINEMGIAVKSVSGTLKDGNLTKWEIKGVQTTADGLERIVTITKTLGQEGWNSTQRYSQALDKTAIAAEKIQDKLKGDNGKTKFDIEIGDVETKFAKLSNQSEELSERIVALKQAFANVQTANASGDMEELVAANKKYEQVLQDVRNQLTLTQQAEDRARKEEQRVFSEQSLETAKADALSRLESLFEQGSEAARIYGARVEELKRKIDECGDTKGVADLNKQITTLGRTIDKSNVKTNTFSQRFKEQWSQYSSYFSVASLFMYAEQGLRSMFEQVKLIDSAMTELKKVTNETEDSYNQFLSKAASRSKEIGTTIDGLVSSTADFARLGYSFEESQGLAEVANIYAVVGDEIDGVEDATQSLVSTLAAFKDEMSDMSNDEFAMSIVDKMNEVANNYAISSGGLGEALQRSASSMAAANNTLDETIAMITAANEVAQNPEKVGNAMKTISMRIRGAKTELEEAGESTDGMAESTASLREEIMALSGVDIMLNEDTFKSTYQIMDELANKWEDLSDIAQATIIELMAGKHQGNIFASLMSNFDTARAALDTSINSSGSALAEHAKWSESLEARLNKLKAAWQGLSQTFMKSDFLKIGFDVVTGFIDVLDTIIDKIGVVPTIIAAFTGFKTIKTIIKGGGLEEFSGILDVLSNAFPSVAAGAKNLITYLRGVSLACQGSGSAISGLLSLIMLHPYFTAAAVAVTALTAAFVYQKKKAEELSEKVDELVSKYKEQQSSLVKGKSSFKTEANRYSQLAKGVDELGRNVSLTSDEYSEYQSLVNSIADQVPSLVAGYDSQGNAILNLKDNAEELIGTYERLVGAYDDLIEAENNKVLGNAKDIQNDFKNTVKDAKSSDDDLFGVKLSSKAAKAYKEMLNAEDIDEFFKNAQSSQEYWDSGIRLMGQDIKAMADLFEENGIERKGSWLRPEYDSDYVKRVFKENRNVAARVVNDFYSNIEAETEGMKSLAQAAISNAFDLSDSDFYGMNDTLKNVAKQAVNSFDYEFLAGLTENGISVESYVNDMLKQLNALHSGDVESIEMAFNLKTKFNNGDISYGEFVNGIEDTGRLIGKLALSDDVKSQLKLSLGLNKEGLAEEYKTLINRLTETSKDKIAKGDIIGLGIEEAEKFIDSLSAKELSVITDIIPELDAHATVEQIQAAIDREMAVQGLTVNLNIEVESTSIDAFNTALQESVSASGLSAESISALKSRYKDLESEGYNLSAMFEETSNGIHLNRGAVRELEKAYAEQKKNNIKDDISALKKEYDLLTRDIESCNDAQERASLYVQRDAILQQINDAAALASQYEGLTSAYNNWLAAEEAGQERDMYEKIIEGLENIDNEISRGWLDDGTIEFLELLTGRDLTTAPIEDLKKAYGDLDKTISKSGYSIRDFFTVNEDGESTNAGVYNFLETVEDFEGKLGDVIKRKDGKIVGFDFKVAGGDEAIADALGISEELVQIMLRAADDAGFVVNIEGAYTQLANLKTEAETARDKLISLKKDGLDKLKGVDVNFDFSATGQDLVKEQEKAVKVLDKFKKDGKIDLSLDGAQEALDIAEYLTIRLDDLTEPRYMEVDASTLEDDLQVPLEQMQEFERLSKEKHLLTLTGDTKGLENINNEMDEIVEYLATLHDDTKLKLGIDKDWTREQIASALEKGEIDIPAELNLDVKMSDDLKDMRLMMMNQLGLASDEEVKLKIGYDIDDSVVNALTEEEKKIAVEYIVKNEKDFKELTAEEKEVVVKYVAKGKDFNQLTREEQEVIVKLIGDDSELKNWTPEQKEAMVKYIVDGNDVSDWTPEMKLAIAKYLADGGDVSDYTPEDKKAFAQYLVDGGDPEKYVPPSKTQMVNQELNTDEVDNCEIPSQEMSVWAKFMGWLGGAAPSIAGLIGVGGVNGTANANGTSFAYGTSGKAFKQGDWRTKRAEHALVGELGREIVVTPDNRWYTVGDSGAEFANIPRGSIVFNHRQTEELLANGRATSAGGRAKALASGTAFSVGSTGLGGIKKYIPTFIDENGKATYAKPAKTVSSTGSSGDGGLGDTDDDGKKSGGGGGGSESKEDFEETIDWIETIIDRIERAIDKLDKKANSIYKNWTTRNEALAEQIDMVGEEIELQQQAYDRYLQEANSVELSEDYASKVRDGTIDIEKITDEELKKKIDEYKQWYDKAIDCRDAVEELKETESELYAQRFENLQTQYDGILQGYEHTEAMLNEYISQAEERGHIVSKNYYDALIDNEKSNIAELQREQADLIAARDEAVESGKIAKYSEEWYNMCSEIDGVTQAIEESTTALLEYDNAMREIDWEIFDLIQERISDISEETDFLIDLMSNDKLFDDDGKLTSQGLATMGLHAQNYNSHMYQADAYGEEAAKLNEQIAEDPYNQDLINRRNELLELQRESILAAEDEKDAIADMVEEGINLELDALQERIDKYNESIDAAKDLYDYQKKVQEQSEEIASLEKQRAAYLGNDSEEGKAKLQEIEVSLKEAKENLQETEYDKYISDQKALLDTLYNEYELILNQRLDNIDYLLEGVIESINVAASADGTIATALGSEGAIAIAVSNNATSVKETLTTEAGKVGMTLSSAMNSIWSTGEGNAKSVLTMYGEDFRTKSTTIITTLNGIKTSVNSMVASLNKEATTKTSANKTSTSAKKDPTKSSTTTKTATTNKSGGDGTPKIGDKVKFISGQYYSDSQGATPLGSQNQGKEVYITNINKKSWATHPYHIARDKDGKHPLGWLKLNQISGYATGKKNFLDDEIAWTQEGRKEEFIVRPSDGAILTPIAKRDSVLTSAASNNIWDMANSPAEFIKENLNFGSANVPNNCNVHSNYTQHLDKVVFNLPNVKNYEELLSALKDDRRFEKLVTSMTIDQIAGKSSLAKGKSIR